MSSRPGYVLIEVPERVAATMEDLAAQVDGTTPQPPRPLSTREAAKHIGMSEEYVRDHARELGGQKRGNEWRFDVEGLDGRAAQDPSPPPRPAPRRRAAKLDLLPVAGEAV